MPFTRLTDRAVLAVTGEGSTAFLQGLVTNDVAKTSPASSTYAALLTPQGKIVTDFLIHAAPDGYRLDVAAQHAADLLKRLKLYRLRAPVGLEDVSGTEAVFAAWGETGGTPPDPRLHALGARWIAAIDSLTPDADPAEYHTHRLSLGVPDSGDTEGQFALDANLEELHGLDFRKGCYVGQEVTARMKHKAAPRRRLARVLLDGPVPPPGTRLTDTTGTEIGEIRTGLGTGAIASIRLDRLAGAGQLQADGILAQVASLAYALPALEAAAQKPTNE
jgi:folate-binding protein YgfZ